MSGWQYQPFEQCLEKVTYTNKIQRKDFLDDGSYPIVSQEDAFINGYWNDESDLFSVDRPVVIFGDHTKVLKYVDFDFVLGADGVKILKPKEFLDPRFFYYQLQTAKLDSLGYARHYKLLKELDIRYPDIREQQRIVSILDEAFAGIATATANAEKNLQNARELFESTLQAVFAEKGEGWVEKSLSDVCDITSKLVDPREKEFQDYKHIGAGNIVTMSKELVDVKTAREEGLKSGKFYFDTSMVLYSKIRPYLMKVAIPDFDGLCSADVYPLLPKHGELDRGFLFYLLLSKEFTDYAIHGSQRAGMPKVNRDHLFKYATYFPPVIEQRKIVKRLDKLSSESRKLEDIYQRKLDELGRLKEAILQKAFAGELH